MSKIWTKIIPDEEKDFALVDNIKSIFYKILHRHFNSKFKSCKSSLTLYFINSVFCLFLR